MIVRRHKMSRRRSRKLFSKTASRTRSKNLRSRPMRGGYRI
ncbi:MAG: nonstructural protein [Phascolarctobacterium sp.]|nr:nonstructural protein [Phascolarctobacterium sp.]MUU16217.1 nonstructural protein [Phascolarctobacterium sp.]